MKAAIYARTNQKEQSTLSQIQLCREYVEEKGGTVVAVYDDTGVSGLAVARDGLDLLVKEATINKFDTVVVSAISRISRNTSEAQNFLAGLGQLGIEFVVVKSLK